MMHVTRNGISDRRAWLFAAWLLWPSFVWGLVLNGNNASFVIDERNGELVSGHMDSAPGCIVGSDDFYVLENRVSKVQAPAMEDTVSTVEPGTDGVTFECRNPRLAGLRITKGYRVIDGTILAKRVAIQGDGAEGFFTWVQGIKIAPEFRQDAYYYRVMFALSGWLPMIVDAGTTDHGLICSNRVACIRRNQPAGIGHYVYTVHDQWTTDVYPELHKVFTPTGWQIAVAQDYVSWEKSYAAETHIPLFQGDHLAFHRIYFNQPKVRAMLFRPRPSWTKDVRAILNYSPWWVKEADLAGVRITSGHFTDGYILLNFMSSWNGGTAGYYVTTGPFLRGGGTTDQIREIIRNVREQAKGRYKIGLYSVSMLNGDTPPGQAHPEWRMKDKAGNDIRNTITDDTGTVYELNYSVPGVKEHFAEQYYNLAHHYDIDQLYIDLGARSDPGPQDWLHMDVYQSYDNYQAVMTSMFEAVASVTDREMSTMGNSPCAAFYDFTYLEHGIATDWKQNSAMVQYGKFTECTGSRMCVLGWDTQQVYAPEYVLALGLIPAQFSPCWIMNDVPVFEASYEIRGTRLVDGIISPRWWLDGSNIECYGLEQGKSKFVNTIGHDSTTTQVDVVIDPAQFGLTNGRPIYLWEHVPFDRRVFRGVATIGPGQFHVQMPAEREGVAMMSFSDVPAVIYSINGRPCRIWMPEQPGICLDGTLDPITGELTLTAQTEKTIEILAYYPESLGEPRVTINDQPVPSEAIKVHRQDGERFLLIPVTGAQYETVVAGATNGYYHLRSGTDLSGITYSQQAYLSAGTVLPNGNIVLGSTSANGGCVSIRDGKTLEGLVGDWWASTVVAMAACPDGNVVFATDAGNVFKRSGTDLSYIAESLGYVPGSITDLAVAPNGNVIIGCNNGAVYVRDSMLQGLATEWSFGAVTAVAVQPNGNIVIGNAAGMLWVRGGLLEASQAGAGYANISDIAVQPNGNIVVGNTDGILRIRDGNNISISLSYDSDYGRIYRLTCLSNGDVVVASEGHGGQLRIRDGNDLTVGKAYDSGCGVVTVLAVQPAAPTPTPTPPPTPTPTPAPIPGDADRNGTVGFEDFAALQNHYGQHVTGDTWSQGDFNGDGQVTFEDFSILQNHYGQAATAAARADTLSAATGMPCGALGVIVLAVIGLAIPFLRHHD